MLSQSEKDCLVRWRPGQRRGHYESLFLKANLPDQDLAFWLQFGIHRDAARGGEARGSVMAVLFDGKDPSGTVAAKETFPVEKVSVARDGFHLVIGGSEVAHGSSRGSVSHASAGGISWDISWEPSAGSARHFPHAIMYRTPLPKTKLLSPQLDTRFKGRLSAGGREIAFDAAPALVGHNWGTEHGRTWVWAHCNAFEGKDRAAFEGISARIRLGRFSSPWLSAFLVGRGKEMTELNALTRWAVQESRLDDLSWTFSGAQGDWRIEGSVHAHPDRTVCVIYHDPPGGEINCINSALADSRIRLLRRTRAGFDVTAELVSRGTTMLEIGDRASARGIRVVA